MGRAIRRGYVGALLLILLSTAGFMFWRRQQGRFGGQTLTALAADLGSPDAGRREHAVEVLRDAGRLSPAAESLVAGTLRNEEARVSTDTTRREAPSLSAHAELARVLGGAQPVGAAFQHDVIALLHDHHPEVRVEAARALGRAAALPEPAAGHTAGVVSALTAALADDDHDVRAEAATAIGAFGDRGRTALPALARALRDPISLVRIEAVGALVRVRPAADSGVPLFARALHDPVGTVRRVAAEQLGAYGAAAARVVPALTRARHDSDAEVRAAATRALAQVTGRTDEPRRLASPHATTPR